MPKRKTHEEYVAELAVKNPGVTVVGEYVNLRTKIAHCCAEGHKWDVLPQNILRGTGCPYCKGAAKKTHAEYVSQIDALNNGIKVVSNYVNAMKKITHRCLKGHEWDARPVNILRGHGCPTCGRTKKKTHADYVAEVEALGKGLTVVGEYAGNNTKITHRCAEGHEWDVRPTCILSGTSCPTCSSFRKKTHAEYIAEIEALGKGFTVLSDYVNTETKITHCCVEGHKWDAKPQNILNGTGCPRCAETASDANVFYIWENIQDPGVYKVGITSERLAENRIAKIAREPTISPSIILMASTPHARDIERRALELGDDPRYPDTIDGYTEFRRYSDAELGEVWRMAVGA